MFNNYLILRLVSNFIFPFICFFALYIQLNGETSPGGGFQAGAIFASSVISIRFIRASMIKWLDNEELLIYASCFGVSLYALTGLLCMIFGGNYLAYNFLHSSAITGQHIGIIVIELGVGITVSATMMLIHLKFLRLTEK